MTEWDYVIALAGNPNTGKSTIFNALTGLRQHTGNWPGKTVTRAEGGFLYGDKRYKMVDLPGTYSLLSTSLDEEVARDFILFGQPDVTVIVVDATRLERNLNLVLQVLEITDRAVLALNLMDEAKRHGCGGRAFGWRAIWACRSCRPAARQGEGLPSCCKRSDEWPPAKRCAASHIASRASPRIETSAPRLVPQIEFAAFPGCPTPAGWPCACWTATSASSKRRAPGRTGRSDPTR
jgi:Fe2+ transport system protein B